MTELFPNVPQFTRDITLFWIKRAGAEEDLFKALEMLKQCRESMPTEEDKQYFDFSVECYLNT